MSAASGLCACGCGQPTPRLVRRSRATGAKAGEPRACLPGHHVRGAKHRKWKGGRTVTTAGYVGIQTQGHPRADTRGYVLEHVLVVERALGKYLDRKHPIHHVDDIKANNANTNLVVCEDQSYHLLLHQRQNALAATGNPNALPCVYCASYERQDEMIARRKSGGRAAYHPKCRNERRVLTYTGQKAKQLNRTVPRTTGDDETPRRFA